MTIEEIKIRQMANQHLLQPTDKMTVLHDLCGVQAQFMVNAMHSLKIRCSDYNEDTVKNGLRPFLTKGLQSARLFCPALRRDGGRVSGWR